MGNPKFVIGQKVVVRFKEDRDLYFLGEIVGGVRDKLVGDWDYVVRTSLIRSEIENYKEVDIDSIQ